MKKVFNLLLLFITFHLLASLTQMVRAMIQRQAPYVSFVMDISQEQESLPYLLVLCPLYISILISMSIYQFETMLFSFLDVQSRVLVLQLCPLTVNTWTNILVFQTYQLKCSMQKLSRVKVQQDIFITASLIPRAFLDSTLFQ